MHPLETYLHTLGEKHVRGVAETSYYGALETLFDEVGKSLKPRVSCVIHPKNTGGGIPDGGLYTPDQFEGAAGESGLDLKPARGVIEIKGPGTDVRQIAHSEQVAQYLSHYGQVLVTNYRDFMLVGKDANGKLVELEAYSLAAKWDAFWEIAANPMAAAQTQGAQFIEYLKRVMLSNAPLSAPEDLARFLASYARDALARLEKSDLPALTSVRKALEEALDMHFGDEQGRHFFRSTLVQTLFYGIFSAWVLWHKTPEANKREFNWHDTGSLLHMPVIGALFDEIGTHTKIKALDLMQVLQWTTNTLNRVDRGTFFQRFEEKDAIQHFYEPFLKAFDPELRKDLGVWYTPPEIVQYMVARVDSVLRTELNIPDGLADPSVYVLDPACGTGAYLIEVLRRIQATLQEKNASAVEARVKQAAMERVVGFEILPAPFVIAHMQVGLLLQGLRVPLDDTTAQPERARIYLTNALTGWEPSDATKEKAIQPYLMEIEPLKEERDAAERVKQSRRILVVLGNPPYNGFAGAPADDDPILARAYRTAKHAPAPQGQGLNDLYVRFYRMAERQIVEQTKCGIVCFISNYSWLDGLSFTGMRERYLEVFDRITIDCMNGDKYKTGKLTPEGDPDPSVFSTPYNREGIQVGTAIALLVRKDRHESAETVQFRNLWGRTKRSQLLSSLTHPGELPYQTISPPVALGLPFMPIAFGTEYPWWPTLPELLPKSFPGVKTSRDDFLVDIDRDELIERVHQYFDPNISDEEMRRRTPGVMEKMARFDPVAIRQHLVKRGFLPNYIVRYSYRPFDLRWLYWEPETKLLDEKRADYFPQIIDGNIWLAAAQQHRRGYNPPFVSRRLSSLHIDERGANLFPLWTRPERQGTLFTEQETGPIGPNGFQLNLSPAAVNYLTSVNTLGNAENLFYHTVAILHTPEYVAENAGALLLDWPRIPLPATTELLRASATLGRRVAALLDTERPVPDVTVGNIPPELQVIGKLCKNKDKGPLNSAHDLAITVGWGHAGQGSVTMPGTGQTNPRAYNEQEQHALGNMTDFLGATTLDIYLNDDVFWANVPITVWTYTIGGYQVMKKWLSYRESKLLGRALILDETDYFTDMARRIAAILLLTPKLNKNYRGIKENAYDWSQPSAAQSGVV